MKHKIIAVLSILVIIATVVLCTHDYDNYRNQRYADAAKAYETHQAALKKAQLQESQSQTVVKQLEAKCASDHIAYLAQPVAQRGKTAMADCDINLQLVQ